MSLLRLLVDDWSMLRKDKELIRKMRLLVWLLGLMELVISKLKELDDMSYEEEDVLVKYYVLVVLVDIVILDDYISYRFFKDLLLCVLEDEVFEVFY